MKKTILLVITIVLISTSVSSQTIEETIEYLNFELSNFVYDPPRMTPMKDFEDPSLLATEQFWIETKFELNINKKGQLHINRSLDSYTIPKGTEISRIPLTSPTIEESIKEDNYYSYLKQLNDTVELKIYKNENPDFNMYFVILHCKDNVACFVCDTETESSSQFNIILNNEEHAIKVKNAFEHLIKLANEKTEYWQSDPFE